jgi:hypothetical protein
MGKSVFVLLLGALTTTVTLDVLAQGVQLKGDTLVSSITGKKFTGTSSSGNPWEATYTDDGKLHVRLLNKNWSDSGTWEIKDDRVCSERTKRTYMCYEVMRVSGDEYEWVDERGQTTKSSGPK